MHLKERIKRGRVSTVLVILILLTWSCGEVFDTSDYEFEEIEATPTLALPLAYGDLSIQDILNKADSTNIKVYPDGLVYLEYDETLKTQAVRELVEIPDENNITGTIVVPFVNLPPVNADYTSVEEEEIEYFDITPEQLTEIALNNGQIFYDVSIVPPNPDFRYAVRVTIPEFTSIDNGTEFSQEFSGSGQLPLTGFLYSSTEANRITLKFTLIVKENPNPTIIAPGTVINTTLSFRNMEYSYVRGFFGDQSVDVPAETIDIDAFGSSLLDEADVSFVQPSIEFTVINDVGVPTKIYFTSLEARKPGSSIPIQINPASPVTVQYPATLGDSAITEVTVTNVDELLEFTPTQLYYKLTARINEGLASGENFIADTSSLKVNMHVEVPLYGKASNISLSDTLSIDLSDVDDSNIESASLKVKVTNEIPLEADVQFYLTDENFVVLDSLLAPDQTGFVESSTVDANGELQLPGVVDKLIPIRKEKLDKIFQAENIIIRARVNTTRGNGGNHPDVKFKSDYTMNIKLGLQAKLKLTADL